MAAINSLDDAKRRILARVSLETLIQEMVTLTKRGNRLTGLCPFHAEKSPSFYVFEDHYHCFGCHAHGDGISFVRQTKELSFIDSLRYLAGKFGVDAPELDESAKYQHRKNEQTALTKIMVTAQDFFSSEIRSERGEAAREYLLQRGFSSQNIEAFGFGLTPGEHFGLVKYLRGLRFRDEDILKVGLGSTSTKTGNMYDFFRERITIPIRDVMGRVIAFGGRTISNDPAKYKNSAATPLFDKGSVLFGLDRAKDFIKLRHRAILVEGYMDALCLWQEGLLETTACMGTALNVRQFKLLQAQAKCSEVILLFDGDNAGRNATLDSIEVALAVPNIRVRAAILPEGEDPDTFIRKNGRPALDHILENSSDLIEVAMHAQLKQASGAAIPTIVTEKFIPWLSRITDPIKRSFLINMVSTRSGVAVDILTRQVKTLHFGSSDRDRQAAATSSLFSVANPSATSPLRNPQQDEVLVMSPTRPLTPVEESFLGHLFHGQPGEIDVALATDFLLREIQLEPLWDAFAKSLLGLHVEKKSPVDHVSEILSSYTAEEILVLNRITEIKALSFASTNRTLNLQCLSREQRRQAILQAIGAMKQEVKVAGVQAPETIPELLHQIIALNKVLTSLQSPTGGRA